MIVRARCGSFRAIEPGAATRHVGAKRSILIEILGLPVGVRVDPAKPHDVKPGRELLDEKLPELPNLAAVVADRG